LSPVPVVPAVRTTGAAQTRGGASITSTAAGVVRYRSSVATDVVVDITGYFTH
jgi:hypothetical protein